MATNKKYPQISDFPIPQSEEIEEALLCEVISDADALREVIKIVTTPMFFGIETRKIWNTIVRKKDNHETIDIATIYAESDKTFFRERILSKVGQTKCMIVDIIAHAVSLRELYIQRIAYFTAINTLCKIESGASSEELKENINSFNDDISKNTKEDGKMKTLVEVCNEVADDLTHEDAKVPSGIPTLDTICYGGFEGGNLVILAARPSVGKTTIALQMAHFASMSGKKVVFYSLEQSNKEIGRKFIINSREVNPYDIYTKRVNWENFEKAVNKVATNNFLLCDKFHSVQEITSSIRDLVDQKRCDIAYIDYLGLMKIMVSRNTNMAQAIGEITRLVKLCAMECGIPIVLLCQLNREVAGQSRSPQLHDLRDSGSIEQDADKVLMMERPQMIDDVMPRIDMWVRKNRGGKAGELCIHLEGDNNYSNFHEIC